MQIDPSASSTNIALADAGAACGSGGGGGGSGTVTPATGGQFAVYPSNGNTVVGSTALTLSGGAVDVIGSLGIGATPAPNCGTAADCLGVAQGTTEGTPASGYNYIRPTAQGWVCDYGTGTPFQCLWGISNLVFTTGTTVPTVDMTSVLNVALQYAVTNNLAIHLPANSHILVACQSGAQICLPLLGHTPIICEGNPGLMYTGGEVGGTCTIEVGTPGAYALSCNIWGLGSNLDPAPAIVNLTIRDLTTNHNAGGGILNTNCNGQILQNVTITNGFRNLAVAAPVSAPTLTAVAGSMASGVYQGQIVYLTTSGPSLPSPTGSVTLGGAGAVQFAMPSGCTAPTFPVIGCGAYLTISGGTSFCIVTPAPTYTTNSDGSMTANWPITSSTFTVSTVPCGTQLTRNPPAVDYSASTAVNYTGQAGWAAGGFNNQPRAYNLKVYDAARAISIQQGTADAEFYGFQGTICDIQVVSGANNCVSGQIGTQFLVFGNGIIAFTGHTDGSYQNSIPLVLAGNGGFIGPGLFENTQGGHYSSGVSLVGATKATVSMNFSGYLTCISADANSLSNTLSAQIGGGGCTNYFNDANSATLGYCSSFNKCNAPNPGLAGTFLQGFTQEMASLSNVVEQDIANADSQPGFTRTAGGYFLYGPGGSTVPDLGVGRCAAGQFSIDTSALQCNGLGALQLATISGAGLTSAVTITGSNDFNGSGNTLTGALILRGANETGTGPTTAGSALFGAGGVSSSSGIPGLAWVTESYRTGGTSTKWNLGCQPAGNNIQIQDCAANATGVIGVQFNSSNPVTVITHGDVFINVSGAATLGDTLCTSGTGGVAVDSGGKGACPFGSYVGIVLATSGTFNLPTPTVITQVASSSLPLVHLGPLVPGNVVYNTQSAATNTNIGSTSMFTTGTVNTAFQFWATVSLVTLGSGCSGNTTVVLNVIYRDPNGVAPVTKALGTITLANSGGGTLGDVADFVTPIWAIAAQAVSYSTTSFTNGGCSTIPTYQVTPRLVIQ